MGCQSMPLGEMGTTGCQQKHDYNAATLLVELSTHYQMLI